jgi:hypothetical protein
MHLTALNAKSEPESELVAEFDRRFKNESPEALQWAFVAWRDRSPFFPAISDISKLLREYRKAEMERMELEAHIEEKVLLEERRRQGQVPNFREVLKELRSIAENTPESEGQKRWREFNERMRTTVRPTDMQPASVALGTLHLTDEQIRARREKEQREIKQYEAIEDQRDGMYEKESQ